MISVKEAISIFEKNVPDKRIINLSDWNGKYVFQSRDRKLKDDEPDWDSSCEVVDQSTGEFSTMDSFNMDYIKNSKDIDFKREL